MPFGCPVSEVGLVVSIFLRRRTNDQFREGGSLLMIKRIMLQRLSVERRMSVGKIPRMGMRKALVTRAPAEEPMRSTP